MRMQLLALAVGSMVLVAAMPGPEPVITVAGVSEAVQPSPQLRAALDPQVATLNATLEKIVAIEGESPEAAHERRARMHEAMDGIHEIMKQLDPEQRAAFHAYLIAQLKAAGIPIPHAGHGHEHRSSNGHGAHPDQRHAHGAPLAAAA